MHLTSARDEVRAPSAEPAPHHLTRQEPAVPQTTHLLAFAAVALGMALTPGPNMVYLISRSICQGRTAG